MIDVDRLVYVAHCVLGFSFSECWRLTPRQVAAMTRQHNRFAEAQEEQDEDD